MKKLAYLASPYTSLDPDVELDRYYAACEAVAKYTDDTWEIFSPIVHYHVVSQLHNLPSNAGYWWESNKTYLARCDSLYVLKLKGWAISKGVIQEMAFAFMNKIPVKYLDY